MYVFVYLSICYFLINRQIEMMQTKSDYYNRILDAVGGMMISKSKTLEEDAVTVRKKDAAFVYEGRRYAKKSKCCK